jgi:hypothetical protein
MPGSISASTILASGLAALVLAFLGALAVHACCRRGKKADPAPAPARRRPADAATLAQIALTLDLSGLGDAETPRRTPRPRSAARPMKMAPALADTPERAEAVRQMGVDMHVRAREQSQRRLLEKLGQGEATLARLPRLSEVRPTRRPARPARPAATG